MRINAAGPKLASARDRVPPLASERIKLRATRLHDRAVPSVLTDRMSAQLRWRSPRVLVVGGGPVGLSMGFLLDRLFNVPTRIIERQTQPTTHPQAHFLNLRTMEVLQAAMPAFHDRLQAEAAPSELWRDYIYCTGVGKAREFARIDQFGPCIPRASSPAAALQAISPTQFLHFPQNRFEAILSEYLEESGLHVDRGVELLDLKVDPSGRTKVSLRHTESQHLEDASYDYVVGADGAHSLVRQLCGIEMAGALNLQSLVNVHFTSKALSEAARENPAMLYFVFNKDVIGVLIAHDLSRGEWVIQIPFFPPQESIEWDFSERQCLEIIQQILPKDVASRVNLALDAQILSVGQWRMSARVAKQYDAHRRVFLVGDAAHQFPPAGGLGMNTGIQDAHNLAWKLALTIQQQDGAENQQPRKATLDASTLLRSYERERQQVAKLNTQLSLRNVERTMKVPNALNVAHNNAKILTQIVNSAPLKLLPLQMQRDVMQNIMKVGKSPLGLLDAASSAIGGFMRNQVQKIVERRASLGMLFYHFDIGFSYDASGGWADRAKALMQDEALDRSALFEAAKHSDAVFTPEFRIGTRFPHFWVATAQGSVKEHERQSTLALGRHVMELQRNGKDSSVLFLLVVDRKKLRDADASTHLLAESGDSSLLKHVALVVLDAADEELALGDDIDKSPSPFASVHHWRVASDASSRSKWGEFSRAHSAALVRPDGHVGFLWDASATPESSVRIVDALRRSYDLC